MLIFGLYFVIYFEYIFIVTSQYSIGKYWSDTYYSVSSQLANSYDVIVNCTGLGSRNLVHDDNVKPIQGQVIRVSQSITFNLT